uniref:Uncharacterized protein n=1 Tax=Oryza rufipogon TaxID=4529 RepID=A0A0E0PJB6_ORYRU
MSRASSISFRLHLQANQFITRQLDGRNKSKPQLQGPSAFGLMKLTHGAIIRVTIAGQKFEDTLQGL